MPLTFEQFKALRSQGLSVDQINKFDSGQNPGQPALAQPNQPTEKPGFFSRVGTDLVNRGKDLWKDITNRPKNVVDASRNAIEGNLRPFGDIAGAATDIVGEGIKSGVDYVGDKMSNNPLLQKVASTDVVGKGLDTTQNATKVLGDIYNHLSTKYPNVAKDIESAFNIASFLPVGESAKLAQGEAKAIAGDIGTLIAKGTQESIPKDIQAAVEKGIEKGIRPSAVGKDNFGAMNQYFTKAKDAVSAIISNKDKLNLIDNVGEEIKGALPKTLDEFSQAVGQTKKAIFDQYDSLTKSAGELGTKVDLAPVIAEIRKGVADPVISALDPSAVAYASKIADGLEKVGSLTAEQAQNAIKQLNSKLESFYKGRSGSSVGKIETDAIVANHLREGLDNLIMNATGEGYQKLKNLYGSLKTIEKDVAHRAVVEARKNEKGLIDFTNIFSYGDMAKGLATGNVAQLGKGAIERAIAAWYKFKNNPNNIIKGMFEDVDKLLQKGEKAKQPFEPNSKLFNMKPKAGLSIEDVSNKVPTSEEIKGMSKIKARKLAYNNDWIKQGAEEFKNEIAKGPNAMYMKAKNEMKRIREYFNENTPEQRAVDKIISYLEKKK